MKYAKEFGVLGVLAAGFCGVKMFNLIENAAQYFPTWAKDRVAKSRRQEDINLIAECEKLEKELKNLKQEQAKELASDMKAWKLENDIEGREASLRAIINDGVQKANADCNYSSTLDSIKKSTDEKIRKVKESSTYAKDLKKCQEEIANLKKGWDKEKNQFDVMESFSPSEDAKKAVRKTKRKAKDQFQLDLDAKNAELETYNKGLKNEIDRIKTASEKEIDILKEQRDVIVNTYTKDTREELDSLLKSVSDKEKTMRHEYGARYEAENKAKIERHNAVTADVCHIHAEESTKAKDMAMNVSMPEKLGVYLRDHDYGKVEVAIIGAIPAVPVVIGLVKYVQFLVRTILYMKGE